MLKRKVFVAYCSKQQVLVDKLKTALRRDFELVLWNESQWSGRTVLDNIINAIHACEFGIALLSCDDEVKTNLGTAWLPRNNVALELGYFLAHFQENRTAIIRVDGPDGASPSFPSDIQGWLEVRLASPITSSVLEDAANRIRARFSSEDADFILSLSPRGSADRGFNVLSIQETLKFWGKFEGEFFCVNPSWTLELNHSSWRRAHLERYRNPRFRSANYVVDIDRGREASALEGATVTKTRGVDGARDLSGVLNFISRLTEEHPDIKEQVEEKIRIYIRPGVRSELTSFSASFEERTRGFLFVRRLTENTVLEARSPKDVARMGDHIRNLIGGKQHFSPEEALQLRNRIVHS